MNLTIYTDGAATLKKGKQSYERVSGGWAFVVYSNDVQIYSEYGGESKTTNNAMELTAILKALEWLEKQENFTNFSQCTIFSDSAYCVNIFNSWITKWENNDWTRGKKKEKIENLDLIKSIYSKLKPNIKIDKIKGHNTSAGNIMADKLAVKAKSLA